jgi:cyanophycinase
MTAAQIAVRAAAVLVLIAPSQEKPRGRLVAVGGGRTSADIVKKTLELAGGDAAVVVVLPQASRSSDGTASAQMWKEAGAKKVSVLDLSDPKAAVALVKEASLVWMPGGDQAELMKALEKTGVPEAIRERHRAGAVVGGTSAGAAALSKVMIAGYAGRDSEKPQLAEGLGVWPEAIVDQHFVARGRMTRLLAAVLEKPDLVGVGVDESTAAVVSGGEVEVVGKGTVTIIDARGAKREKGEPAAATDVKVHVLKAGMKTDLSR